MKTKSYKITNCHTWSTVSVSGVGNRFVPITALAGVGSLRVLACPVGVTFVCFFGTFIDVCAVETISGEPSVANTGKGPQGVGASGIRMARV